MFNRALLDNMTPSELSRYMESYVDKLLEKINTGEVITAADIEHLYCMSGAFRDNRYARVPS